MIYFSDKYMREKLKKIVFIKNTYYALLWIKNSARSLLRHLNLYLFKKEDYALLKQLKSNVAVVHPQKVNLTNDVQSYLGKNIIGYPALSYIYKDGTLIGWSKSKLEKNGKYLPFLQVDTDTKNNIPALFSEFKPEIVVDFGTASGGSSVFYYDIMKEYCTPAILSIDISGEDVSKAKDFHDSNKTWGNVQNLFGKSSLDRKEEVLSFIGKRAEGQKVLFSFDDDHSYDHTYKELCLYAPMLKTGDIILMQDTWDQGLYGHETSPMLAVEKFLKQNNDWEIAVDYLKKIELPGNFIYGVIVKK